MEYRTALTKAWSELEGLNLEGNESVRLLNDKYDIDFKNRRVFSTSCNVPAKDYISILVLHYCLQKYKGLPAISGEWISFKQLEGGQGYYPTFKKRAIGHILSKYRDKPGTLFELTERFNAKRIQLADVSVVLEVFDGVPVLITLSRADEEFGAEANILFDKTIKDIFCTEDVVVLAEFVAHNV